MNRINIPKKKRFHEDPANPDELGGLERLESELALSLLPRGRPAAASAIWTGIGLRDAMEMSSWDWDRAKKSSSASYGEEDAFI